MVKRDGILFLTLKTFSATGGIEKVCRVAGKALFETGQQWQQAYKMFAMHDQTLYPENTYFPGTTFKGFNGKKIHFTLAAIFKGYKSRLVILSHINLLLVGYCIKLISPKTSLILIAHGIEVWTPLAGWRKKLLYKVDLILPVSRFTREKMKAFYQLTEDRFNLLNNSLDPFLSQMPSRQETFALRHKYGFNQNDFIMLTLSRLSGKEKNKGYDKILFAQAELIKQYPNLRYLFVGKYDEAEKSRLDKLIAGYGLTGAVVFSGFVPDAELAVHYSVADLYIMPSEKEGFGISFIEAIFYGIPVIAGNRDGTTDALFDGKLGTLVDPRNQAEITNAITNVINNKESFAPNRGLMLSRFGYEVYKENLQKILAKLLGINNTD